MTTPTNLREFPQRTGIVIDLGHLRAMMEEFLGEMEARGHAATFGPESLTDWKFETFLQWAAKKQKETMNDARVNPQRAP
jgi:hypothetical protein